MREDEIEALLKLDGAGLRVVKEDPQQFFALIYMPHDLDKASNTTDPANHYVFRGTGVTRQEALANVWQKYQTFMSTKSGQRALAAATGQLMFRI
jgi:hypothetical protein